MVGWTAYRTSKITRGALVRAEGDERYKSIRRRVAATEETTIHDLPVRLSSAVSPSQPHLCFSLILSTRTALDPARVLHALTEPAPRDPRHAAPQDHLLEVVFGHLAADSKPREYFDAMLTCVPSLAFSSRPEKRELSLHEKPARRRSFATRRAPRARTRRRRSVCFFFY